MLFELELTGKVEVDKEWGFDICSFYHKLRDSSSVVFPWKGVWKVKVPQCVSFFVEWCIRFRRCGETMDHLMLHCEKAHWLWSFVFRTFGISWFYQDRF